MKLEVHGISFEYQSRKILNEITCKIEKNQFVSILGPNGVGKTTLLRCLNRILKPADGEILIENRNLLHLSRSDIAREISYVSQKSDTSRLTAFDAILMGRMPYIQWKVSDKDLKTVNSVIEILNMQPLMLKYIDQMSGGEFQKVCIARALVQEPTIMLLDEPTSSLDLKNQQEILNLISDIVHSHQISAIMTIHDINIALRYSDKILFLKNGVIHAAVTPAEVTPQIVEDVYDVKVHIHQVNQHRYVVAN